MNFIEKNWLIVLAFLMTIGGLIYLLFKNKAVSTSQVANAASTPAIVSNAVVSASTDNTTKSASLFGTQTGKPVILLFAWPSDPTSAKSLLVQCRATDVVGFSVGDSVTLPGSNIYPGKYKIWYDYSGTNPAIGPVRNLYLETKFISNEPGVSIAKA